MIKTNPDMEIWWDSSPLIFDQWVKKMVDAAEPLARNRTGKNNLSGSTTPNNPAESVFRGCTTNPPLSWGAVQSDPKYLGRMGRQAEPGQTRASTRKNWPWLTYKEIVRRGAEMMMPIYEASNGRFGWISGQLDPRLFTEIGPDGRPTPMSCAPSARTS